MHLGHQALLAQLRAVAEARGLKSAVVIFEPHPREFFAPQQAPARLTSLREKLELLAAQKMDRVHVCRFGAHFARIEARDFARALRDEAGAALVLVGDDFHFGKQRGGDFATLQRAGAECGFEAQMMDGVLQDGARISSTAVRAALAEGRMDAARAYLGRYYGISGRVVHGDGVGRKLGFRTANIPLRRNRPALQGVYAARVRVDGLGVLRGAASLGVRPTVHAAAAPVLEVHLLDFNRQIYGRHLRVEFLHKLRDEAKFPDLAALTAQIALDVEQTKRWFEKS